MQTSYKTCIEQDKSSRITHLSTPRCGPWCQKGPGSRQANLQGHALALDLGDPRLHAVLGHLRLVVLVARQANELGAVHGLGLHVVVAIGRPRANNVRARALEAGNQLVHGVAEVVAVAALVAQAEDGHLLALEVKAGEVAVDELVPRGARALGVRAGVPGGRANDDAMDE